MTTEWMRPRSRSSILAIAAAAAGALMVSCLLAQDDAKKPASSEVMARVGARPSIATPYSRKRQVAQGWSERSVPAGRRSQRHEALRPRSSAWCTAASLRRGPAPRDDRGRSARAAQGSDWGRTDAEVDAFCEANWADSAAEGADHRPDPPLTQQGWKADADFFAEMEKSYKVDYLLEPLRVEVSATGSARGPATAPVTIVEFSDFQCPYCKRVVPTLDQVAAKYGDKVRVVYRHFPLLSIHPNAQKAEARCAADQGKFWEMHDLFNEQQAGPPDLRRAPGLTPPVQRVRLGHHAETVKRMRQPRRHPGTPAFFVTAASQGRSRSRAWPS
jgi:thiol-disulfide isomerase/thioredoxin